MQDLYGISPPLPTQSDLLDKTTTPASGSSPPPSLTVQDPKMEQTTTDTKEEYQISTRSGRTLQKHLKISPKSAAKTAPAPPPPPPPPPAPPVASPTRMEIGDDDEVVPPKSSPPAPLDSASANGSATSAVSSSEDSETGKTTAGSKSSATTTCPICAITLDDQHELTLHIRSHNSSTETPANLSQFVCRICSKVLSSSSSLDRHVLVHSGERPFRCKVCAVTFTTNGNMHRHMRTHSHSANKSELHNYESDDSSDSSTSGSNHSTRKSLRKRRYEYNNNNYSPIANNNNNNNNSIHNHHHHHNNKRKVDCLTGGGSDGHNSRRRLKTIHHNNNHYNHQQSHANDTPQKYHCPVCDREDFASLNVFEMHLEESHPEYQIKCHQCNLNFKNHRVLNLHRFMVHHSADNHNATKSGAGITGFQDLTFVDFSSQKFPHIARAMCEESLHKAADDDDLNFQCAKCSHGFPCASALEIHQKSCFDYNYGSSEEDNNDTDRKYYSENEDDVRRVDFFAGLDLQNKSQSNDSADKMPTKQRLKEYLTKSEYVPQISPTDTTKGDLADIQSIISVTSTPSLLQHLTAQKATPPNMQIPMSMQITPPDSHSRSLVGDQQQHHHHHHHHEEEVQDQFAAEFRRMKLRGEFPCRLCTAVFPNLRALKGHNRAHLSGNGASGPYRCNMCPHSSIDKAALVRHMRTHNGDRPYECSLCNYAFTTKANCERHLRNRHGKVTREEVKRAIIYHPSEDPTNDEAMAASAATTPKMFTPPRRSDEMPTKLHIPDVKRSLIFPTPPLMAESPSTSSAIQIPDLRAVISKLQIPTQQDLALNIPSTAVTTKPVFKDDALNISSIVKNNLTALKEHRIYPKPISVLNLKTEDSRDDHNTLIVPKIQVKNFSELKQPEMETPMKSDQSESEPEDPFSSRSTLISTPLSHYPVRDPAIAFPSRTASHPPAPIDLSMDVLDLSKKRRESTPEPEPQPDIDNTDSDSDQQPQDFTKKTLNESAHSTPPPAMPPSATTSMFEKQILLAQQYLKNGAGVPPGLYASHLHQIYGGVRANLPPATALTPPPPFANIPGFGIAPYFLQTHPFLTPTPSPQDFLEMKERFQKEIIRGLQLSGGSLIMDHLASEQLQAIQKQVEQNLDGKFSKPDDTQKPLNIETSGQTFGMDVTPAGLQNIRSPIKSGQGPKPTENIISTTPNSVKMVIKNGVLMPKQKQRRYRTERPFSCEHCTARFTLRSNMERHIKQQHPQFWSQRQRSNLSTGIPGRKPSLGLLPNITQQTTNHYDPQSISLNIPHKSISQLSSVSASPKDPVPSYVADIGKPPLMISDQVKYAILAQQLKQQLQNTIEKTTPTSAPTQPLNDVAEAPNVQDVNTAVSVGPENEDDEDNGELIIDENSQQSVVVEPGKIEGDRLRSAEITASENKKHLEQKIMASRLNREKTVLEKGKQNKFINESVEVKNDENMPNEDLVPVAQLLDNAAAQVAFRDYFQRDTEDMETPSEEDEEGLVASGSTSEGNASGSDGNRSESELQTNAPGKNSISTRNNSTSQSTTGKKKSAYSLAPNRVTCPYCHRKFPWSSSLRRHILTHTGQKPFKCSHCPLLFTTKSNCDRHLLRKHGNVISHISTTTSGNVATAPASTPATAPVDTAANNASNYMMRNVPERPFKCSNCPSSTFSTLSNLKKHMSCKHNVSVSPASSPPPSKSEEVAGGRASQTQYSTAYDSHSSEDELLGNGTQQKVHVEKLISGYKNDWEQQINLVQSAPADGSTANNGQQSNSDLPFKCHLCDSSYGERQDALDHIREQHSAEYELLMSKGALENQPDQLNSDPNMQSMLDQNSDEQEDQSHMRGKFPDYANRKVMCAFCMRRFWSAEDLRRHMRTHTGERPFSCDVCRRRFTLKHSMLRHRKKHNSSEDVYVKAEHDGATLALDACAHNSGDDDDGATNISSLQQHEKSASNNNNNTVKRVPLGTAARDSEKEEHEGNDGGDLIGNLLGIRDSSIIDQVLRSSADDAAKLLGVKKSAE